MTAPSAPQRRSRPPTRPRRLVGLARAFAIAVCACVLGCSGDAGEERVATAEAERARIERIVVATGTIEPGNEVEVRPRIAGIVEKIHVVAGDDVKPGQSLLEIERDLLESRVREAEAAVQEARVELRYAKIDVGRTDELEKSGATSPQKGDTARARFERAQANLARARAALDTLSTQLGYATVKSPIEGRILDVPIEEGSAVSPVTAVTGGTLLFSLAATDTLHLEGLVDENEIARVAVGQSARIRTEAFADHIFEGRVRKIAPLGQRVQNVTYFEIEIEVIDPDADRLRPRMSADGEIIAEIIDDAIVVPETALRYRGDDVLVEVVGEAGAREERVVEIGIVDGTRVQVLTGLEPGEAVRLQ